MIIYLVIRLIQGLSGLRENTSLGVAYMTGHIFGMRILCICRMPKFYTQGADFTRCVNCNFRTLFPPYVHTSARHPCSTHSSRNHNPTIVQVSFVLHLHCHVQLNHLVIPVIGSIQRYPVRILSESTLHSSNVIHNCDVDPRIPSLLGLQIAESE